MTGKNVNKSGYLLTGVDKNSSGNYTYRGVEIPKEESIENLKQYVYEPNATPTSSDGKIILLEDRNLAGSINKYLYKKVNGVKYYASQNEVFTIINDVKYKQSEISIDNIKNNTSAIKYYEDAYNFKKFIAENDTLKDLTVSSAVDSNGKKYEDYEDNPYYNYDKIFEELFHISGTYIEDANSNFNAHKLQVIKNSIESNLMVAIANYNKVSTSEVNFQMPKLQDYEWEQITQNISMITFLQGLNIGGKIYNGHSIVSNNNNEDYVSEDSIYILDNHLNTYYKITDSDLLSGHDLTSQNATGILNSDFERRTATATYGTDESKIAKTIYYYPKAEFASYNSIINANGSNKGESVSKYVKNLASKGSGTSEYRLAQIYYTALGRERYGMYRVTNFLEDVQEDLIE